MIRTPEILIVEDSPTQALHLQSELAAQGWNAVCAGTANEALQQLDRSAPDVIIVDYLLPGMNGLDFCRRLRMNINTRGIPVIMLTADEDESTEVRGLDGGADDFFKKSVDLDVLIVRIRSMLERSRKSDSVLRQSEPHYRQARILALDDSATYLSHLGGLLESEGYAVEAVTHPGEALARIESAVFDLVLVDLVMPELDGIEVCRRIVAMRDRLDNPIAVLMLTGREAKEDLTRALEAGADDFVGKSSDQAVLKGRIRALLRRKFFQEENQRILEELKNKELEAATARAEKEAALARAADERRQHAETVAAELQQAKNELERSNDELTRSNDELRQFAYLASHDLQEPLRSIASFCSVLKEECQDRLTDDGLAYVERIVAGAARMQMLVTALLGYCRISNDEQRRFAIVNFAEVVRDAFDNLQNSINASGAEIACHDLPEIVGDRIQLVEVIQNLVGNAILYRGDRPPRISVEARRRSDHWEFAVRDNGIGIAPEHRERIFEIFKRLHNRNEYPGTGIGLAVCRKIVERHGGKIWVDSQPGQGSAFHFTICTLSTEADDERSEQFAVAR